MKHRILSIIQSESFKNRLQEINNNYANLKQEVVIRNSILESLNKSFQNERVTLKAFAEHPRDRNCRVDLSIVDTENLDSAYHIEFKYQYTSDYKEFLDFKHVVDNGFGRVICGKQTDLFTLIVVYWNVSEKEIYDRKWGLKSNLSRFLSIDELWKSNLKDLFTVHLGTNLLEVTIQIEEPYRTNYSFFMIDRNAIATNSIFCDMNGQNWKQL